MSTQEAPVLKTGDRVALKTDTQERPDKGTVVDDEYHARKFVRWDNGRTWVYASTELRPI